MVPASATSIVHGAEGSESSGNPAFRVAPVAMGKLWGFVDGKGDMALVTKYDTAHSFAEGLADVKIGAKWGYIDRAGKVVIPARFEETGEMNGGLAPAREDKLWGFIDAKGAWVIQPKFEAAKAFDDGFADLAFVRGLRGHRAVGHDETSHACGREVMEEMLYPRVVGVVHGRHPVFPAHVLPQVFVAPIAHVEWRVGENEIGLEVGMQVAAEAVGVAWAEVGVNAANGEVHPRQFPGGEVGFLPVNGDVADASAVFLDEFFG